MAGIARYSLTLLIELVGVALRYIVIEQTGSRLLPVAASEILALIGGIGPPCYSLLAWFGPPGGHWIVRWKLQGRRPTITEQSILTNALRVLANRGISPPDSIYILDQPGLNAGVIGHTLYIHRELLDSPHLAAVLAHEMGHYHSGDGRLALALQRLTIPGGKTLVNSIMHGYDLIGCGLALVFGLMKALVYVLLRVECNFGVRLIRFGRQFVRAVLLTLVGGYGIVVTTYIWRDYLRQRELAADRFAAYHGFAYSLLIFLEQTRLLEMNLPWTDDTFHPAFDERIAALQSYLRHLSGNSVEYVMSKP
ncbi:M48 family metallopeptidase [Chloroflexus aggregans]|uniref:Peptidase M48 Ste24p n=1 Tax=Chloroflexus aggregans (strain MD-66 / DSM 9485) TaxID=326427 RepID=B8G491_CHLAD|nr:M48 family metalloprotease [Chloroflexus aggregans]ACL23497.1 peptidase M48 Ste24p [Chloroflexus aggregans DSM 9485]